MTGRAITLLVLFLASSVICKIILPHKLRYLENMLNAEVISKASKIRERMEANPNIDQDMNKGWPLLLAKIQADDQKNTIPTYYTNNLYNRRV